MCFSAAEAEVDKHALRERLGLLLRPAVLQKPLYIYQRKAGISSTDLWWPVGEQQAEGWRGSVSAVEALRSTCGSSSDSLDLRKINLEIRLMSV